MQAVKFLERPSVIRFFGVCLLLAPFINIVVHIFLQSQKSNVTAVILWKSLTIGTFSQNMQNLLSLSSLVIGTLMLLGTRRAWSFVLGLIGLHIIIQTTSLLKNLKESWIWGGVFLVNLAVFFFIADQLVFKEKRAESNDEPKSKPQKDPSPVVSLKEESPTALVTKKRIIIHFSDLQMWAQLMHISNEGLLVKSFENQIIKVSEKMMVVFLKKDLPLRLKLDHARGAEYFFKFLPMSPQEIQQLNLWILEKADVKRGLSKDALNSLSFTKKVS